MPRTGGPPEYDWRARHLYNITVARMQLFLDEVRADPTVRSIQAAGFCYGGGVALGMLSMARPIKSAVAAHPTWTNNGLNTLGNLPQLINGSLLVVLPATRDDLNDEADRWIMAMWRRNIDSAFNIYPDTGHGFAFDLPPPSNQKVAAMRAQSIRDTIHWLNSHDNVR